VWPTFDDIIELSYHAVDNHQGFRDDRLIDGALGATRNLMGFVGITDVYLLAAHLLSKIQRQQALVEGNKRTATLTALYFLEENGVETEGIPAQTFAELVVDLAEGRINEEQMAEFIRQNTWKKNV
jgi:death-on-curing protein